MRGAVRSRNDSAQSPTCSRNAWPTATPASADRSCRASPANTSGGNALSSACTAASSASSGHSGCCAASSSAPRGRRPLLHARPLHTPRAPSPSRVSDPAAARRASMIARPAPARRGHGRAPAPGAPSGARWPRRPACPRRGGSRRGAAPFAGRRRSASLVQRGGALREPLVAESRQSAPSSGAGPRHSRSASSSRSGTSSRSVARRR